MTRRDIFEPVGRSRGRALAGLFAAGLLLLPAGCRKKPSPPAPRASALPLGAPTASAPSDPPEVYDLVSNLSECEIHYRGLSIDLGTRASKSRRDFSVGPFSDVGHVDREGASFARVFGRKLTYDIWVDAPQQDLFVSLRVHAGIARGLSAYIDRHSVGSARIHAGQTQILTLPVHHRELARGHHTLMLRFWGARRRGPQREPYVEIDWVRIAAQDQLAATYAAPTLRDVVSDEALDGGPKRSLALRAPSTVRCAVRPAPDAALRTFVGFWGAGKGVARVRVVQDGQPPVTLVERKVVGGPGASWIPLKIPLARFSNQLVGLELDASEATRGGRVIFGDPVVVHLAQHRPRPPRAKTVILILGAGIDRHQIPPWGNIGTLTAFGELTRGGVAFSNYRVPSTVPAAVLATILTGLPPRAHSVEDPAARLPASLGTVANLVKQASGRTAMFTSVPTSFAAFGFDSGWDQFKAFSPVADIPAAAPYTFATTWLDRELQSSITRRFVVLYTRGVHPPWDVSRSEVNDLKPPEYDGVLDARRGGVVLGRIRRRTSRRWRRLGDQDWVRLVALENAALAKENAALQGLIDELKKKGAWDDTLLIYAGDVGPGEPPTVPFAPAGRLREDRLLVPLLVKFPGHALSGKQIDTPVTSLDVTRTIVDALGLKSPNLARGIDLYAVASGVQPIVGRPLLATRVARYSTRVGLWRLSGKLGRVPKLCNLRVDPSCVNDVLNQDPISAQATWQWTFDAETAAKEHRVRRQAASIDPDLAAALTVWGDVP